MNLEIFKKNDPSGSLFKEKFLIKNYIEEYNFIISFCEENNLKDLPFKEKVYLCINKLSNIPKCKNPNCNKIVKYKNSTIGYLNYCSNKCISSDDKIKKAKQEKSYLKFGTKTPAESNIIKEKIIETNLKKYGVNSPMILEEIQKKSKETLIKNWGVDNPNKSDELSKKRIENFKLSNFKENFKKSSLEKYGVEHPWMVKDIHNKTIEFFYSDYKKRIENSISNDYEFIKFNKNITTQLEFFCKKCKNNFNIVNYQFYYRLNNKIDLCTNCFPISENSSIKQIDVYNFIKENYKGEILSNVKNIISPYEIDIYLPELNLGFEFNGLYWHSEKFKKAEYHLLKKEKADENNINLFSIWEDDWVIKKDICKSFILNKLGLTKKIGARKCIIKEVDYITSKNFLDLNHLQGDCKSSIRIGLFYNNELVNLMTFSKLRLPLNGKNINDSTYELTRYCNIINTNIVGGASKLLNYFIKKWNPLKIETYSDNLISNGNMYEKLGFEYSHTSKPGYWYVIDKKREHRFNWRKSKLVKMGYSKEKTEEEIMLELGYYRVYNGGNKKWIFLF